MRATRIPIGLFIALLTLTSCEGTTPQEALPPQVSPTVWVLKAVSPMNPTGIVGEELDVAPTILVTQDGLPMRDTWVSFTVSDRGSVGSTGLKTNAAGLATPEFWRLGPGAGPQTLKVRAVGQLLVFTANAQPGPITSLAVVGGNSQWAAVGTPLPTPLRVKATDGYGNVVSDAAVTFAVVDGGGSLAPAASITASDGIAESKWTLGTTAGRQHVRAQTGDVNAQFTADACQPECSSELAHVLNGNIVIFNSTTGATRQLTHDGLSYDPAWSPDGERIAFARYDASRDPQLNGIYVMNADGTGLTRVTGPGFDSPTWSPQGDALAFRGFSTSCTDVCRTIYVQELREGSVMRRVAASGFAPAWSPDGTRIAFVHEELIPSSWDGEDIWSGMKSLWLVNPDGSGLTEITPASSYISRPTWSPDGTRIAFDMRATHSHNPFAFDIYVVRADGTGRVQLTTQPACSDVGSCRQGTANGAPAWSPDGTRVAYDYGGVIMQIPAEGGEPSRITFGYSASWRP